MRKILSWFVLGVFITASIIFFVFPDYAHRANGSLLFDELGPDNFNISVRTLSAAIFLLLVFLAYKDVQSGRRRHNMLRRNAMLKERQKAGMPTKYEREQNTDGA